MDRRSLHLLREKLRRLQRELGWQQKNDASCCGVTVARCHALLEIGRQEEISLAETIRAVEGDRLMLDCPFSLTPCGGQEDCPLAPLWDPVRQKIVAFLEATSLAQVAKRRKR